MDVVAANAVAVLLVLVLLGIEVWVVAIAGLGYLVSREAVTLVALVKVAAALGASAVGWVVLATVIGALAPP